MSHYILSGIISEKMTELMKEITFSKNGKTQKKRNAILSGKGMKIEDTFNEFI